MGKRIISQKRGKGSSTYRISSFRSVGKIKHRTYDHIEKSGVISGIIKDIIHCPIHLAPLLDIKWENGQQQYIYASSGIKVKDIISSGSSAQIKNGNTLPLKNIPNGTSIYNIESLPGDGGKFVRSPGTSARVLVHSDKKVVIELPSKKQKTFDAECRATIGVIAGSGRKEKPFIKAGKKYHYMKAQGRLYPRTSAVSMNAVAHPFGSGRGRNIGKSKIAPRFAPPGRKVGLIRSKRTGRK